MSPDNISIENSWLEKENKYLKQILSEQGVLIMEKEWKILSL